ncbi:putative gustatory receptor 28b [Anopheles nili]|uniref:putative gustatory receptor 28b n=1 Tax=Anopheles nili TaxID=185578 RepID=UPI00237A207D|nr:putative gustatory receptor 28b [Anopheles nili]
MPNGNRKLFASLLRFPKRDVFDCVPLHYLVLKMSGMGCITPRADVRNGSTITTFLDVGLFITNLMLAISMMIYGTFIAHQHVLQSPVMYIGTKLVNFTCYGSTIYGLMSCFINRHEIWKFYNEAFTIDGMLHKLGERTNFNRSFVLFVTYYGLAMGTCIILIVVIYQENMCWMLLLNMSYSYFCLTTFHIVSLTCLDVIWVRNLRLNRVFQKIGFSSERNLNGATQLTVHGANDILQFRQIMQIFDLICDLADKGSFYYGIQMMISMAGSFIYLLFYTFAFTLVIRSVLPFESVFNAGSIISYMMFAYNVLIVALFGNSIKQQGKFTSQLIDRAINATNNPGIIEMLEIFLLQLGHRTPLVTCGLFPFDWTLFFSILSTAATYIIILLQFESAGNSTT